MTNEILERGNKIQKNLKALDSLWQNTCRPVLFFGNDAANGCCGITHLHSLDEETQTILLETIQDIIRDRREALRMEFENL